MLASRKKSKGKRMKIQKKRRESQRERERERESEWMGSCERKEEKGGRKREGGSEKWKRSTQEG